MCHMSWVLSDLGLLLMHTRLFTNKLKKDKEKFNFFINIFIKGKQMGNTNLLFYWLVLF